MSNSYAAAGQTRESTTSICAVARISRVSIFSNIYGAQFFYWHCSAIRTDVVKLVGSRRHEHRADQKHDAAAVEGPFSSIKLGNYAQMGKRVCSSAGNIMPPAGGSGHRRTKGGLRTHERSQSTTQSPSLERRSDIARDVVCLRSRDAKVCLETRARDRSPDECRVVSKAFYFCQRLITLLVFFW